MGGARRRRVGLLVAVAVAGAVAAVLTPPDGPTGWAQVAAVALVVAQGAVLLGVERAPAVVAAGVVVLGCSR